MSRCVFDRQSANCLFMQTLQFCFFFSVTGCVTGIYSAQNTNTTEVFPIGIFLPPVSPSSHIITYLFAKALYWLSLFILFRDSLPRTHPSALLPKPASKAVMSQSSLNCTNWTAFPVAINILSFQRRIGRQAEF